MTALVLPFGAIADARSRQRRRRIVAALAILLLVGAAGIGADAFLSRHHASTKLALIGVAYTPGTTLARQEHIAMLVARNNPLNPDNPRHVRIPTLKEYENAIRPLITHRADDFMPVFRADVAAKERELRVLPGVARFYAVNFELP